MNNVVSTNNEQTNDNTTKKPLIKPVVNAVQIIRYLNHSQRPEKSADIARHLNINPSTCFNILRTLVDQEILEFNPSGKTYYLGLGLLKLVKSSLVDLQRTRTPQQVMSDIANRFKVTMTLWKQITNRIVLVGTESSPSDLSISMSVGHRLPLLMGASGRLMAAHIGYTEEQLQAAFNEIRWAKPISFEKYCDEVEAAKNNGWAIDNGHFSKGIMTVAVPIYDHAGKLIYTLSAVMMRDTLKKEAMDEFIEALQQGSKKISDSLAY